MQLPNLSVDATAVAAGAWLAGNGSPFFAAACFALAVYFHERNAGGRRP